MSEESFCAYVENKKIATWGIDILHVAFWLVIRDM